LDPGTLLRRWLRPDDAAGAAILAGAARAAALPVGLLALGTAALVPLVQRAVEAAEWRRLTLLLATAAIVWTATFDAVFHPAIARARSTRVFLEHVDGLVPREEPLYARFTREYP